MDAEGKKRYETSMKAYLEAQVSRANLLKAAGIGALLAAVPNVASAATDAGAGAQIQLPFNFPTGAGPSQTLNGRYATESTTDILNIAQTAEYFAVTFLTAGVAHAADLGLNALEKVILQAILAAEITHVQLLSAVGATPITQTFTIPDPKVFSDFTTFWSNVEAADTIFVAAYMAANRQFAEQGQGILAKYTYQIGGVEAEHRVLARGLLTLHGKEAPPPNNKAYETDLFLYVREAAGLLIQLGFVGGSGTPASFPGLDAAIAAAGPVFGAIIQKSPNNASEGSTTTANITLERA